MRQPPHPTFLDLAGRRVVVVGGGAIGARKALDLVPTGADLLVVAPEISDSLRDAAVRGALRWEARAFEEGDLDGAWFVVTATGRPEVDAAVANAANARHLFVNAVDDPALATAYAAGIVRRAGITIAISSGGRAPALVRLVREALERILPEDVVFEGWLTAARRMRGDWQRAAVPYRTRTAILLAAMRGAHTEGGDR